MAANETAIDVLDVQLCDRCEAEYVASGPEDPCPVCPFSEASREARDAVDALAPVRVLRDFHDLSFERAANRLIAAGYEVSHYSPCYSWNQQLNVSEVVHCALFLRWSYDHIQYQAAMDELELRAADLHEAAANSREAVIAFRSGPRSSHDRPD